MYVTLLKIPDHPHKVIPRGHKVFLFDTINKEFINKDKYDKLYHICKRKVYTFSSLNLSNAYIKVNKLFRINQ